MCVSYVEHFMSNRAKKHRAKHQSKRTTECSNFKFEHGVFLPKSYFGEFLRHHCLSRSIPRPPRSQPCLLPGAPACELPGAPQCELSGVSFGSALTQPHAHELVVRARRLGELGVGAVEGTSRKPVCPVCVSHGLTVCAVRTVCGRNRFAR